MMFSSMFCKLSVLLGASLFVTVYAAPSKLSDMIAISKTSTNPYDILKVREDEDDESFIALFV